jgi:cytochrome c oxidase subunit 3
MVRTDNRMQPPTNAFPVPPPIAAEEGLNAEQWGMAGFLLSEVAFFSTLIVTYVTFMGQDTVGPTPAEALSLPLVIGTTICLVSSSVVIHAAERALARGKQRAFCLLWAATILLGIAFLLGTAYEWRALIVEHHLTISRNLFGTTYYTLVGFHGLHVTAGVIAMLIVLRLALRREVTDKNSTGVELVAWYWHFVDAVWIVVFLVVYVAGTSGNL